MAVSKIWVFDPCLFSMASHNFSEAQSLLLEAAQLEAPLEIYCFSEADAEVRNLPARPLFRKSGYSHLAAVKPTADFVAAAYCNQMTLEDLRPFGDRVSPHDFVFIPTVTCNIVLGVCQWLATFTPETAPWFGMCLMVSPDTNTVGAPSPVTRGFYERAFKLLPPWLKDRVALTCETEALSDVYEPITGKRPLTLTIPTWSASPRRTAQRQATIHLSFLGDGRVEKGFGWLPEIVERVRAARGDARFTVQATGCDTKLVGEVVERLQRLGGAVTVLNEALSSDDLFAALRNTDLLLLPYDAASYRDRGSSFFTEAKALGVPLVMPAGTAIGAAGERAGVAELFDAFTAESVAAATLRAIERLDSLSAAAQHTAEQSRANNPGYLAAMLCSLRVLQQ